jgi:hemin uptake protein HemP
MRPNGAGRDEKERIPAPESPDRGGDEVPVLEARRLFGRFQEIRIQHRGEEYRLRITRNHKLILTK